MEPIFVKGVRVLGPFDYDRIVANIEKDYLQDIFEVCFWSGMRYVEVQRLYDHPEWIMKERRTVHLPAEAQRKAKRTQLERYIYPIPPQLESVLRYFFKGKNPPSQQSWNNNLKRWCEKSGISSRGVSSKSTRKSIESWMISAGIPLNEVCLRQGHDSLTSMRHYQGLPFTPVEKEEIKRRLSWF
ncbi:MAG: site-specific integrase [Tenericutes bacterium]|nr:site-specific integrase [Mycoplasmatota bacterium]MBI9031701.1 site-specific integrase [bacterium]